MLTTAKTYGSAAAGIVAGLLLAALFTGSVLGAEGRLPSRFASEAVALAVTTSALPLVNVRR